MIDAQNVFYICLFFVQEGKSSSAEDSLVCNKYAGAIQCQYSLVNNHFSIS